MAKGRSLIVGGGLGTVGAIAVGALLYVTVVDPPQVQISPLMGQVTGAAQGIVIAANRTDPQPAATEVLRVRGGAIIEGTDADTTVIGRGATAVGAAHVAIGRLAAIANIASQSVAVGTSTVINGSGVAIGSAATIGGGGSAAQVAIGNSANTGTGAGGHGVVIGNGASISNAAGATAASVCIGGGAGVTASRCVVVGYLASSASTTGVAIGSGATNTAGNVVIGFGATSAHAAGIAIGSGAITFNVNQLVIGGPGGNEIAEVCIGHGDTSSGPLSLVHRQTNGVGTDIAGGNLTLQAGLGTSNGLPGEVRLTVGVRTATGSVLQVKRDGVVCRFTSTAGDTYLMLFSVDHASGQRVSIGAADSGGVGFKVLRIPN